MPSFEPSRFRSFRRFGTGAFPLLLALVASIGPGSKALAQTTAAQPAPAPASGDRWTAATPDEMVDLALKRARGSGSDALAALVLATNMADRVAPNKVSGALLQIAATSSPFADDARWLAAELAPDAKVGTWPGARVFSYETPPSPTGLVTSLAILGPFQDSGGGLQRHEGPERLGESWTKADATYSWGVYEVAWRKVLPTAVTARGVPLDLYVHPRTESCTILASKVSFPGKTGTQKVMLHAASTGSIRLIWDGQTAATSDEVHTQMVLDRLSVEIDATPGDHLVAAKVCSAAIHDEGRVRLRFTDAARQPITVQSSATLAGLSIKPPPPPPEPASTDPGMTKPSIQPKKAPPKPGTKATAPRIMPGTLKQVAQAAPKAAPKPGAPQKKSATPTPTPAPAPVPPPAPPPARRVDSTLEKALKLGENPSITEALASAVLRTLGGADHATSPRAPGLLDRVTRDAAITPDALAMAGWIATSGSNRSGWLNLAYGRGLIEKDPATAAFAQRRLAAGHLNGNFTDWALDLLKKEPLASASDPEARLMRAMIKRRFGGAGLARVARAEAEQIAADLKDKTPLSVLQEIAMASGWSEPDTYLALLQRIATIAPETRDLGFVRAHRHLGGAAMESAAAHALMLQTNAGDVVQLARMLHESGRYTWAREIAYVGTVLAPNQARAFTTLAETRRTLVALAPAAEGHDEELRKADEALQRARDLEPGDPTTKAEAALRSGQAQDASAVVKRESQRDEQYLPKPEEFLARARNSPVKKGDIFDRQLHWVRVVTYHPDKRVSQLMHYAREIVIEPRTDQDLYEPSIPSEGDDTELLYARLHRKDGTVLQPEEQSSGGRRPYVKWPELHTGDVVEVAVRSWTDGPVGRRGDPPFYFIDYVGSTDTHPILYNEVVVDSPEGSPLAMDVLNGKAERHDVTKKDGRVIDRFVWESPPSVPEEPLAPRMSEVLPVVVGSTFAGWDAFREWYRGAVTGFTEPDEQVKRLATELTKDKPKREDKIRALFEFVADDIRYVNYVSGEWWLPNRPQELLARRQGDCDDKAMLLITLLKAIGINATEVLVQTRYTAEPSLLRSEKVAIPVFDHGIAYLPGEKGKPGMWLDATSPESRLGPLPSMDARAVALFVHDGAAKIIDTPSSSVDDHGVDAEWTLKLTPQGGGELIAKERHTGDSAFELRMNLKEEDTRLPWVERYVAYGFFSAVQIKPEISFKSDLPAGAAILEYQATSETMARKEGAELAVPLSEITTLTSQLAPLTKRTLPVALPPGMAPAHQKRVITIVAPEGFQFAELPPGGEEKGGEFGNAKLTFAKGKTKDSVVVTRSIAFDLSVIPVDKYEKWRAWLQRVDRLMHQMVRLTPVESAAAKPGAAPAAPKPAAPKPAAPKPAAPTKKP